MTKALVILSGGQDSTTCLFWAKNIFDEVEAVTFDYGQKHAIEIDSAIKVAELADVKLDIIKIPGILLSKSPLTDPSVPLEKYDNPEQMDAVIGMRREDTFVPMRNALFITIAANRAEARGIKHLVTGVCQMDNANYDDCRSVFIRASAEYINTALGHDHRGTGPIRIVTPLMHLSKAGTVLLAHELGSESWNALAYTHTSYDGKYPPTDMNHANVLRADGFEKANLPDPLVLRAHRDGLMPLPLSSNYDNARNPVKVDAWTS